jgi:hypothetical protein
MYALAHASISISKFIQDKPHISAVRIFSDCSSAIKSIFNGGPHAAQAASIFFRTTIRTLLTTRPNLTIHLDWTPGHSGVIGQEAADKAAKKGASRAGSLIDFDTKSHASEKIHERMKKNWKELWEERDIREGSGFFLASEVLRPSLKPDLIFKTTPRELSGRLAQAMTGHCYSGGYYKRINIPNPIHCDCSEIPIVQTVDHIIRFCPKHDKGRKALMKHYPRLENPRFSLSSLFRRKTLDRFLSWMKKSGAFSRSAVVTWDKVPPDKPK